MIRALAFGGIVGLAASGVVAVAFYYGIWPVSVILDHDTHFGF